MDATVVVVDDDAAARHSLEWLLASCGYRVCGFDSGASCLCGMVKGKRPACFILDIHMPGMNGIELHAALKKQYADVAVIFLTAYPSQELAEQARRLRPVGFFEKPLDIEALLACLTAVIAPQH